MVILGLGGLAVINVVVPLMIVKLATRAPGLGSGLLMALPAVVAIPMSVIHDTRSVTPSMVGVSAGARHDRHLATLGGLPVVVYFVLLGSSLLRGRWRRVIVMVGLSVITTVGLGAFWMWSAAARDGPDRVFHLVRLARVDLTGNLSDRRLVARRVGGAGNSAIGEDAMAAAGRGDEPLGRGSPDPALSESL